MPEGDTIHKIAAFMAPLLEQRLAQRVKATKAPQADRCSGQRISSVQAKGKHLMIEFDSGTVLRSHLGMYGSWHRYAVDEKWRRPAYQASLELATDTDVFVCFNAKELEVLQATGLRKRIIDSRLGPDLTGPEPDIAAAVKRAREFLAGDTLIGDVLLDQRAACGIGNVYKSEILFIHRRLPHALLASVTDAELASHYQLAANLLSRNLGGGKRVTRFERDKAGRLWVYRRRGLPCLRCDDGVIASARIGQHHRGTYWCPACQA